MAEISRRGHLATGRCLEIAASTAAAAGHGDATRTVLLAAVRALVPAPRLYEALLQTYLFAGYPRAINALTELRAVLSEEAVTTIPDDDRGQSLETWTRDGEALCSRVYGPDYEKLLRFMDRISPDLGRWMVAEGYGKVLSRGVLSEADRELCAVGALVAMHVPPQLKAHLRGALLVGASAAQVRDAVDVAGLIVPHQRESAVGLLRRTTAPGA